MTKVKWFFILLLLISDRVPAQNLRSVSKVIFEYAIGGNSWGSPGIYSTTELFEITPVNNDDFKITRFLKIFGNAGEDGETFSHDTIRLAINDQLNIPLSEIDSLYIQLNTTKKNFTYSFIRSKLHKPTKHQIIHIAKLLKDDWKFKNKYTDSPKEMIKQIKNFDKLDTFIKLNKPDTSLSMVSADAWDELSIYYINKRDTIKYINNFEQLLGQPFTNIFKQSGTANLEINNIIENMIPKSSLLAKKVSINSLTEEYIKWYVDKVL